MTQLIDPRPLGSSEVLVPAVGMGCNNFSRPQTVTATQEGSNAVIHAAIDAGIAFFDGAELYGAEPGLSETFMGVALKGRRSEVVLASKFGHSGVPGPGLADAGPMGRAPYIRAAIEGSLRRLQTDYLDLYQMHTPDPETPIEETLSTLADLVTEGKVRAIGNSNFSAEQIGAADSAAQAAGFPRFVSAQNEYSLLNRKIEADVLPVSHELGLGMLPYFPLFNGLLTGKYTREGGTGRLTEIKPHILESVNWEQMDAYQKVCDEAGATMLQATFAWLLAQPGIASVISGATRPEQVHANAEAGATRLPQDVLDAISELFPG